MNEEVQWFFKRPKHLLPIFGPQLTFTFPSPVIAPAFARMILDCTEREMLRLMREGALWRWNLSLDPDARPRKVIRLLSRSVLAIHRHDAGLHPVDQEGAVAAVLPEKRTLLGSSLVRKMFQIDNDLLYNLVNSGQLARVKDAVPMGNSYSVSVASLRQFLQNRFIE